MEMKADFGLIGPGRHGPEPRPQRQRQGLLRHRVQPDRARADEFLREAARDARPSGRAHNREFWPVSSGRGRSCSSSRRGKRWTRQSAARSPPGEGRLHHRRRQLPFSRHHPPRPRHSPTRAFSSSAISNAVATNFQVHMSLIPNAGTEPNADSVEALGCLCRPPKQGQRQSCGELSFLPISRFGGLPFSDPLALSPMRRPSAPGRSPSGTTPT